MINVFRQSEKLKCYFVFCVFLLSALCSIAQTRFSVQGTVYDEKGIPIPSVRVSIQGKQSVSLTDTVGRYTLANVQDGDVLIFASLGFITEELQVIGQRKSISINLKEDIMNLEEVVVIGYGEQKKSNLTGSVDNIDLRDVEDRVFTDAGQLLQGKSPGLQLIQESGQPGEDFSHIQIRGVSSIENNSDPLVIIDGIQSSISDVNPNDIATISVLKDAASAAIYGNRAAGGVILITTRQGGVGLQANYIGTATYQNPTRISMGVEAVDYAVLRNEARRNSGLLPSYSESRIEQIRQEGSVNWHDEYFSSAYSMKHYLNFKGGLRDRYQFNVSGSYLDQDGVLYGTGNQRTNYLANLRTYFLDKKLQINAQLLGYNGRSTELFNTTRSVLTLIGNASPISFVRSEETGFYSYQARLIDAQQKGGGTYRDRSSLKYQLDLHYKVLKDLSLKASYAQSRNETDFSSLVPNIVYAASEFDEDFIEIESGVTKMRTINTLSTFNATLNYLTSVDKEHNFALLLGYERLEYFLGGYRVSIKNVPVDQHVLSLGDPGTLATTPVRHGERASLSYFSRFTYNFREKYLFEVNARRDGSSRFAPNRRWGTFPSVSAGWVVSKENFLAKASWLDMLKLRASWGKLGNEGIQSFYTFADVMTTDFPYSFGGTIVPGTAITSLAESNTTWETTTQTNIGIDVSLKKRFNVTADYFYKRTDDILGRVSVPGSLGISVTPFRNLGSMVNKGFEMGFQYNSTRKKSFSVSSGVNITYLKNKVEDLGEADYVIHSFISGYNPPGDIIRSAVGSPFGSYFGYKTDGIYQISDFTWQHDSDPSIPFYDREFVLKPGQPDPSGIMANPAPGDIKFVDLNGDKVIDVDDKTVIGSPQPRYMYAANVTLNYKRFSLNVLGHGILKSQAYLFGAMITPFWNNTGNISKTMANNRWTPENPSNQYQRLYTDAQRANIASDYYIFNTAYFRLKNVFLTYTFNPDFLKRLNMRSLKVFATGENLFTISDFEKGLDPEKTFERISVTYHPLLVTYSLGVNIGL